MMTQKTMMMSAVTVLVASLALAGCERHEETQTASADRNTAVVQGQPAAADTASKDMQEAKDATKQAANDIQESAKSAADQASNKVADAVITTTVNAELAKDPQLSAVHIDVDTEGGHVALKGTAPNEASKERATQLASNVKGVVSVDNQLKVEAKG